MLLSTALACVGLYSAGCGGDESAKTTTVQVTDKPSANCHAIEERSQLAETPPRLSGYQLRNQDLDNLSGATEVACNQRQLIYWGPQRGRARQDRLAVSVTIQFFKRATDAAESIAPLPGDKRLNLGSNSSRGVYEVSGGQFASQFSAGKAYVVVSAGCADPSGGVEVGHCQQVPAGALRAQLEEATKAFQTQLTAKLS